MEPIFSLAAGNVPSVENTAKPVKQTAPTVEDETSQQPSRVAAKRVIRRNGSGFTPSIKDALSGKLQDQTQQDDAKEKLKYYTSENLNEPFTKEQFEAKWTQYLSRLDDRPNLKATLSRTPDIVEGCKLNLKIGNSVQDGEISKIKPDLVSWLRKELRNTNIELVTEIVVQEVEVKPYSETEKLIEMVRKNPHVNLLKQTFNLDFGEH